VVAAWTFFSFAPTDAAAEPSQAASFEEGTVLVGFIPGTSEDVAARVARSVGALDQGSLGARTHKLRVIPGAVDAAVSALKRQALVAYAEPNYILHASTLPNDPGFGQLWSLNNTGQTVDGTAGLAGADINATQAWSVSTGSKAIVVGVADSGIDYTHPDLAPNVYSSTVAIAGCPVGTHGYNAIASTCDPMDDNNHGTHVAGTIGAAGNNALGVTGVNWNVSLMGLKFLDSTGSGTMANAISAIDFAVQAKLAGVNVRVLNASWGGQAFSQALLDEINKAGANDILFVAAAGNSSSNNDATPTYPANFGAANEIAVAATDQKDNLASFSNYGANTVDLGAPGANILSTVIGSAYAYASGTSMATPHVSGAAALILSTTPMSVSQLKSAVLKSIDADPALAGKTRTGGRLNICKRVPGCGAFLSTAPSSLTFGTPGGTNPAPQNLTLQNTGTAEMTWTASVSTGGTGNWLVVSPSSGSLLASGAASLRVAVQASALTPGSYPGSITVNGGHAAGSPASIPVSLTVTTPSLQVSPLVLNFSVGVGGARPPAQSATVANQGAATLNWSITTAATGGGNWLTVSPAAGTSASGTSTQVSVGVNPAGLAPGSYRGTLSVMSSDGGASVSVTLIVPVFPGQYQPLPPARIMDTRIGQGGFGTMMGGQTIDVQVAGQGGVPSMTSATPPSAVVLNLTVTSPTLPGYLTVYPTGVNRPLASNLNFVPGQTVANLVEVALGTGGKVSVFDSGGTTDVIFDVAGWASTQGTMSGTAGLYRPLVSARLVDTRTGLGGSTMGPGQTINVQVTGNGGVPVSGVSAAVFNVTATNPSMPGYLTVFPAGTARPLASNLNFTGGQTVPNRVMVKLDGNGQVSIFNIQGTVDVVVDVGGWFTDGSDASASGGQFTGLIPARILDTRDGSGGIVGPVAAGGVILLQVAGRADVPAVSAPVPPKAAVLNVTVTDTSASSYLTAYPSDAARPLASDLNWLAGHTMPNLVVVKLSADGRIAIFNFAGSTDVVADVVGWYN